MADDEEVNVAEWTEARAALKKLLVTTDAHPFVSDGGSGDLSSNMTTTFNGAPLTLVAGVDVSYVKRDARDGTNRDGGEPRLEDGFESETASASETAVACLTVLSFPSLECVHVDFEPEEMTTPYVPGFLAFRELPPLLRLLRRCPPQHYPALVFVDGNGVLHPEGFGLASHLGVVAGIPTVGVGKSLHHVDGLVTREIRAACDATGGLAPTASASASAKHQQHTDPAAVNGAPDSGLGEGALPLIGSSGTVWGAAVFRRGGRRRGRGTEGGEGGGVGKPVYVSVGHGLSLRTAVALTKWCSRVRVPEPVRLADIKSREYVARRRTT